MKLNKKPTYKDLEKQINELKSGIKLKQAEDDFNRLLKKSEERNDELILANEEIHSLSAELLKKNKVVSEVKNKFKNLFDKSNVSIWEQDFSEAIELLNKKKAETGDIEKYLNENTDFVKECISKIKILNVNKITLDLIGVKDLKELVSHIRKTNSKKTINILKNELISIVLGKKNYVGETEFERRDGSILYATLKSTMIDDFGGNIASVINISGRKQAEEVLRASEENYRELVEQIPDGVYKSTHDGKFVEVNSALVKMLGYNSKEDLLAIDIKNDLYVYDTDRQYSKLNELNQELAVFQVRKKDGEVIWVEVHGWYSLKKSPKKNDRQGIMRDVTGNKFSELKLKNQNIELIRAKNKAEESDQLKSAFLSNMSHEIRTPMNGILGFSELLKEPNLTGDRQQEYISIIEKSGQRMLNILNDIVSISKIESGLMEVNIQDTNINEQIDFIHSFFKFEIEGKGIRFLIKNSLKGKEAYIRSDSEKIYGILTNLIKNAIKFTKEGTIELGCRLRKDKESPELEFYVKDTGIGIPKDRQKPIFDRFIQADVSGKMAYQGAGLGLSISKAYVELLGGEIWTESKEGKGSVFYFTLPCRTECIKNKVSKNVDYSQNY
jgi:PAS domain S-box-containing protein